MPKSDRIPSLLDRRPPAAGPLVRLPLARFGAFQHGVVAISLMFGLWLVTLRGAFALGESFSENSCPRGCDWRRGGRRQHAVSPRVEGLGGCRSPGACRADRGVDLACGGPAAAVQHELHRRSTP